mmetsp:Transcript_34079/g.105276  ORF Transcript_34079/g.105276 Transcript_34079/m.105276 type:complete len:235 (-) Transcript_34079:838-1542(-)
MYCMKSGSIAALSSVSSGVYWRTSTGTASAAFTHEMFVFGLTLRSKSISTLTSVTLPVLSSTVCATYLTMPLYLRPTHLSDGARPKYFLSSSSRKSLWSIQMLLLKVIMRFPRASSRGWFGASTVLLPSQLTTTTLIGSMTASRRSHFSSRSSRTHCSSLRSSMTFCDRVMPTRSQKWLIAAGVYPRRRMPASVSRRGSSNPRTILAWTRALILRFDSSAPVTFRRLNSHTWGR